MEKGWVKLYRNLLDKAIWKLSTPEQKTILITLLLMANHEKKDWEWKGKRFICKPGQMVTSLEKIAKEAGKGISIRNVRTAIERLQNFGFLTNESTKQNRLITICNWDSYQQTEEQAGKEDDKQPTNDRQSDDKQPTTNKNDKNVRKKEYIECIGAKRTAFVPPTLEEVNAYVSEKGYTVDAERFIDFYTSKGWMVGKNKMKDWKAAVRNWWKNEKSNQKHLSARQAANNNINDEWQ